MMWISAFADCLLYAAFAYVAGFVVLQFVPDSKKPVVHTSRLFLLLCVTGIALFSAAPIVELAAFLNDGEGWLTTFLTVLLDYRTGQGWVITVLLCILLWLTFYFEGPRLTQASFALLLAVTVGFYSHVSTVSLWAGSISHFVHFTAMSLWAGILLHIAWASKDNGNWSRFLGWFTPFAISCMAVLLASGIVLMLFFVEAADYVDSWVLPYGQMLLLKHLSIFPLLVAALINGILSRDRPFDMRWLRVEAVLLFFVFLFTAIMSKEAPPHDVSATLRAVGTAPIVELLKGEQYMPLNASLTFSVNGILLLGLSILFIGMMLLSFYRQATPWLSLVFGTAFIVTAYVGLLLVVSF
ncbi:copper resistance D family protein [Planococcus salinus]|uniref:Copper resistance protein D domain-containing protein n=1 Tax=Planococcus salinus TaxID=1848460 RepID=A0A3M8P8T3_9BACL|nr:CopD family protein [Planococcus salinus]RNF40105.1 hypothetical protein EEX84_05565 [Planococcus salinus]